MPALYNQQFATTTETCLDTSQVGYCASWQKTTTTSYAWFDTLVLFLLPLTIIWVARLFIKRK